jgi:formiminotetrahydrofolate cyclodeaminase
LLAKVDRTVNVFASKRASHSEDGEAALSRHAACGRLHPYDVAVNEARPYLDTPLAELLDLVAAKTSAPGGGSGAAIAVALGAGLVSMAARFSTDWADAGGATAQAEALRARAAPLAQADADAYAHALEVLREPGGGDPEERDRRIGDALSLAADVPLQIAETAADVAALAAEVTERGNPNLRGDAAAAAVLAEAGARIAANLVAINLTMQEEDERVARALAFADAAARAAKRAVAATA